MKKYHTKDNKKWEYKVEKINVHSAEAIQKEIDSHEKDIERIQKLIENGNSNDQDILNNMKKNSEVIQNCEKEIQNAQNKIEDMKNEINETQKELLLKVLEL